MPPNSLLAGNGNCNLHDSTLVCKNVERLYAHFPANYPMGKRLKAQAPKNKLVVIITIKCAKSVDVNRALMGQYQERKLLMV